MIYFVVVATIFIRINFKPYFYVLNYLFLNLRKQKKIKYIIIIIIYYVNFCLSILFIYLEKAISPLCIRILFIVIFWLENKFIVKIIILIKQYFMSNSNFLVFSSYDNDNVSYIYAYIHLYKLLKFY
jgi:hypothetical protein